MFIDVDYSKKPQKAKYYLAKPNKQIISHIYEKFNDNISFKLGNISELNFSIPYYITENKISKNKHVDLIKEKMLIKMVLGKQTEWFIIDNIEEDGSDSQIINVTAYSLGYELTHKRIKEIKEESINVRGLLETVLLETVWKIGNIDEKFIDMYRSFDVTDSNALDCVIQIAETFGTLIVWNTQNRIIHFEDLDKSGKFKGMTVSYGNLLRSVKRSRSADEMATRLYVEGSEGLTIHGVNPTGQGYIDDFSFFMYPFERDVNKNIVKSSHFMSDALCHSLLDYQELVSSKVDTFKTYSTNLSQLVVELSNLELVLAQLEDELENIIDEIDVAKAVPNQALVDSLTVQKNAKQVEINNQQALVDDKQSDLDSLLNLISELQDEISIENNFTIELQEELNLFIIEAEWKDDRYIDAEELYRDAIEKFKEIKVPKVVINIDIENLFNIVEEQYYWDKLVLGDLIKIKYPQMNMEYMAKIVEIDMAFENGDISVTIANTMALGDEMEKLKQILYGSKKTSSLIQSNKNKWGKIGQLEDEVLTFMKSEWDANKRKITAGVDNQIEIGKRGIIIKNPTFPDEVVVMQSGIIALSKNGGEDWQTAITPDGIIAERLVGEVVIGRNLFMTNTSGKFRFDEDGVTIEGASLNITGGLPPEQVNLPDGIITENNTYNGVKIDSANGIVVTKSDNKVKTTLNATEGIKIQTYKNNQWQDSLKYDVANSELTVNGRINAYELMVNGVSVLTEDKLKIKGNYIDKLTTDQLIAGTAKISTAMIENLVVGTNVTMGAGASLSWSQISSKPTASDLGAMPTATYIDANGIFTGQLNASKITTGTLIGDYIQGGTARFDSWRSPSGTVPFKVFVGINNYTSLEVYDSALRASGQIYAQTDKIVATQEWVTNNASVAKFG